MINANPQNVSKQTTTQHLNPTQSPEVKPKLEFGTVQISVILGIIFTAIAAYISKILLDKRQRFKKASDDFRSVFDRAIYILETKQFCDREVLREEFPVHEKAMIQFRDHLKARTSRRCCKDWEEYKQHYENRTNVPILCLIGTEAIEPARIDDPTHHAEVEKFRRQQILDHIKKLRSYTK